ncbi:sporulation integral membrane protein YlbJ [Pullulanibacillus pueri]|uniref:Sporulation integral membrane protein YlbJ n=1 Tax=Pullulanibacillus pueri TaxID=1437324 RepID=A0A8J2ZRZ1_9BACL|nr:sporulation integral membrane protein YlbJ [Pullulanibacillus pueri]MBM7680114.1 sporulation integral membrane protein YlbJ [Pullulanibacillus pueri]GGH74427.1 sporulation integral membrane protein YlbJ [Pullulanibacillus pueri]
MNRTRLKTYVLAAAALFIAGAIIAYPKISVEASLSGLKMWWNIVFPSLLPFFIISELLIGFGIVTFIGVLLEPIMRPIFKVPGVGGFVLVMGMASGFPAGAKISSRLYEEKQLTKTEAERLAAFTNFSNPLFLFGAIAVGFFGKPELGIVLALSHYIGNLLVGFCMRFYKGKERVENQEKTGFFLSPKLIIKAADRMHHERIKRKKPFGKMLGDAVQNSVTTLLMVGGFIILFSVLNKILDVVNATEIIASFFKMILYSLHMTPALGSALVPGLFEITVGSQSVSQVNAPLIQQVIMVVFVLGFGGFSIQAQVASILSEAKLSAKPFFIGRLLQGFFSAIAAVFLFHWFAIPSSEAIYNKSIAVFQPISNGIYHFDATTNEYLQWGSFITLFTLVTFILLKAISKNHTYSN